MTAVVRNEGRDMNGKTKKSLKKLICAGLSIFFIIASAKEARTELIFENILVTTEPGEQCYPDVWGNYIVWSGTGNTVYDISQKRLAEMPGLPPRVDMVVNEVAVWGNKIIWEGSTGYYDIDLQKMVYPEGLSIGRRPAIYNNKIVWRDSIGYYDIELQQMVYPEGLSIGSDPAIHNNKIIWLNSTGYYDIDLQQMVYLKGLDIGEFPAIYNNKIVWFGSIGYYDIDLEQMVYPEGLYVGQVPDIFEDNIVWGEGGAPGPPANIFMWDPVNGTRSITERGVAFNPKIYNDIVVWEDLRNGNWDVYMAVIPEPATVVLLGTGLMVLSSYRKRKKSSYV
jgi:beta propeller repeat protein